MPYKILIIDDDKIALFLHETVIADCGASCTPETFTSAESALSYLNESLSSPGQYLIFLDVNMPGIDGWAFSEVIKNHPLREQITVVMVSSSVEQKDIERARSSEVISKYLIKPLREEQVLMLQQDTKLAAFFLA
ncbi:MAG: response regulator [Sphingobacteriales bacterium]|nr:MAG: response regulator [Sphingobacteriales bacterium]